MFRSTATALAALAGAALLGGCANLMQRSTIAPDWFQAKAVEVKGEGYPQLADVPKAAPTPTDQAEWQTAAAKLTAEAAKFEAELAKAEPMPTEEEIRARAAQLRALLEGRGTELEGGRP